MKLQDPNLLGVERYAEANYYQDLMFHKDWLRLSWDEIQLEDRNRYRARAVELLNECKVWAASAGHFVD